MMMEDTDEPIKELDTTTTLSHFSLPRFHSFTHTPLSLSVCVSFSFFIHPPPLTHSLTHTLSTMSYSSSFSYWRQPMAIHQRNRKFAHDYCDCCSDCGLCLKGWCCFPCLVSENSARLDNNDNSCACCYPGTVSKNRNQAKAQFAITESGCMCIPVRLFPCCSEIQIKKELDVHYTSVTGAPSYMRMN